MRLSTVTFRLTAAVCRNSSALNQHHTAVCLCTKRGAFLKKYLLERKKCPLSVGFLHVADHYIFSIGKDLFSTRI